GRRGRSRQHHGRAVAQRPRGPRLDGRPERLDRAAGNGPGPTGEGLVTSRWMVAAVSALVIVAARAEPQSPPVALDQSMIRVQSQSNELFAMREAPVAYSTLEQMSTSI